jgi:hypothetical protein
MEIVICDRCGRQLKPLWFLVDRYKQFRIMNIDVYVFCHDCEKDFIRWVKRK